MTSQCRVLFCGVASFDKQVAFGQAERIADQLDPEAVDLAMGPQAIGDAGQYGLVMCAQR